MGITNIFDSETNPSEYHLKNYSILPGFNATTKINDMAIIFLNVTRNSTTNIIKRESKHLPTGTICYVTGWGSSYDSHSNSDIGSVDVAIAECASVNGSICTSYVKDGTAGCSIDPGSPLICDGKVAGVASAGLGCAFEGLSNTIFTNVSSNEEWIKEIVGDGSAGLSVSLFLLFSTMLLSFY